MVELKEVPSTIKGVLSNKISKDSLKPGDHIYSWRNAYIYSHHGIYVGEGRVIHFTRGRRGGQDVGMGIVWERLITSSCPNNSAGAPCIECGDQSTLSGVILSCLDCFLYGGDLHLFKYGVSTAFFLAQIRGTCTQAKSDPWEDVRHRVYYLHDRGFGVYDMKNNNCEHFATYCKTGLRVKGQSGQASTFSSLMNAFSSPRIPFLTTSLSGLTAFRCGLYCVNRYVSDIGVRSDVIKVPVEELLECRIYGEPDNIAATKAN